MLMSWWYVCQAQGSLPQLRQVIKKLETLLSMQRKGPRSRWQALSPISFIQYVITSTSLRVSPARAATEAFSVHKCIGMSSQRLMLVYQSLQLAMFDGFDETLQKLTRAKISGLCRFMLEVSRFVRGVSWSMQQQKWILLFCYLTLAEMPRMRASRSYQSPRVGVRSTFIPAQVLAGQLCSLVLSSFGCFPHVLQPLLRASPRPPSHCRCICLPVDLCSCHVHPE